MNDRRKTTGLILLAAALAAPLLTQATEGNNLPGLASNLLKRMMHEPFEVVADQPAGSGIMGARKWTIRFKGDGRQLKVKWKKAPRDGEGWNNSPRRELGAYRVQALFLDPQDYVVPPTTTACVTLQAFGQAEEGPQPNLPGTRCVYGVLSVWLQDVEQPKKVLDADRFRDDVRYAFHLANMNLLCYLINHQDGRKSNYLVSNNPDNPRVFSVDNGLAFGVWLRNYFIPHWNRIRVPALPRQSVERLRQVQRSDLEQLGVLAQMRADGQGDLHHVAAGPNLNPERGNRLGPGRLQIGLTRKEILKIEKRIRKLLAKVDAGKVKLM